MVDRLNVSINSLQSAMGTHYVPKWTELASSVLVIAAGVIAFRYAVIYLDILPKLPKQTASLHALDLEWRTAGASLKRRNNQSVVRRRASRWREALFWSSSPRHNQRHVVGLFVGTELLHSR